MIRYLTTDDLLAVASELAVGPVRDLGLVDSAAGRPSSAFAGQEIYPTIEAKAAVLLESLVRNHPLVDGNKRLAWTATAVFCLLNGRPLRAPHDDAYDLIIDVITGDSDWPATAARLKTWLHDRILSPSARATSWPTTCLTWSKA
ncbi:MAG: type II toxin-antitoxin system death-on-curing family toxin [Micrococcales bacterium]|nr:type II toxin-antitoxin system death-on-curing family toxin [Micrococcales bacterium]